MTLTIRRRTNIGCSTKGVYTHETTVELTRVITREDVDDLTSDFNAIYDAEDRITAQLLERQDALARTEMARREAQDQADGRRFS